MCVSAIGILIYNFISIMREVLNIYQQQLQYMMDPGNLVTWVLCVCSTIMISPLGGTHFGDTQVILCNTNKYSDLKYY